MASRFNKQHLCGWTLGGLLLASACATGCQVRIGGQTLPSPWYATDDVQYFPAGHEFYLQNEADFIANQNGLGGAGAGIDGDVPFAPPPAAAGPGDVIPGPAPAGP